MNCKNYTKDYDSACWDCAIWNTDEGRKHVHCWVKK